MNRAIAWWAENHVVANLLMVLIIAAGLLSVFFQVPMEVFPEVTLDMVLVQVPYLGAAPDPHTERRTCSREIRHIRDTNNFFLRAGDSSRQ